MSDTSLIFNILAKDKASQAFNQLKLNATHAFDLVSVRAFRFAKDSVHAFEEAERGQLLLEDAFAKFPALADTNIERLRNMNSALEMTTRFDDDVTASGQAKLAMFKFTGKQIEALTPLMLDFAAKTGGDATSAATIFGKAMLGQGRGLKAVGINFKDTGTMAGNFAELQKLLTEKVGGFANKEGKTAAGQTKILSNMYGELQEKIGGALVPVLLKLAPPLLRVLNYFQQHSSVMIKVLAIVGSLIGIIWLLNAAVRAYTTVQIALNIAMSLNPIGLIIIAIVVLVGVFVILWMKSAGFRNFFIGMWHHIWGFLKAVGAWFAGPFAGFFVRGYNAVKSGALAVAKFVHDKLQSIINFVLGMPDRIARAASGMWNGIVSAFKSAINWLIRLWNNFHLTLGGGSILGMSIPSITLSTPDIPYLAEGGIVTRPTLAVLGERGPEAVMPLSRAGSRTGQFRAIAVRDSGPLVRALCDAISREVQRQGGRPGVLGIMTV